MAEAPNIVLIEGDGIGPEITEAALTVIGGSGARVNWCRYPAGMAAYELSGDPLPPATLEALRTHRVALKGPLTTPMPGGPSTGPDFRSVNVRLRQTLELFANVRPARSLPGVPSRFTGVDLVFIRENTEGLYSGLEHEVVPGVVTSLKVATRVACLRVAEFAFSYALANGRKKVTGVHKANIMKLSDGLALECYREVAKRYPKMEYEERIIDATAMSLVLHPEKFDVLLMENLYGDILSDLGAGLVGGLGLAPSVNIGVGGAIFEAVHGSAPDIAGQGIANPTALILCGVALLKHIGQPEPAAAIERAVFETLRAGVPRTRDLGGSASTREFTQAVTDRL